MLALTVHGATETLPESEKDAAMRRYFEAFNQGDMTARLVRLEDLPAANTAPTEPPEDDDDDPPPAAPAGVVSPLAVERIQLQETWVADAGFALAPPLYAPGTRVLPVGDHNFRVERQRVEALPPFRGAAAAVIGQIRQEARRDQRVRSRQLLMDREGDLRFPDDTIARIGLPAFYQLANLLGFGMGARYLSERCHGELRAKNVNEQLHRAEARDLVVRTRASEGGGRDAYAIVTPTYTAVDTDDVLTTLIPALAEARTEMLYDGSGVRATALFMPDHVVDLAAGDIFKAGVRVTTDDTGRGRIRVEAVLWRNRCLNLLVIGEGVVETVARVHKGSAAAILTAVREGVTVALGKVAPFLDAWGVARTTRVDPEVLIREWVTEKKLFPVAPKERDAMVEALLHAWQREPGDTLADAVNALTRAAHEEPAWSQELREIVERRAGELVLVSR